MKRLKLLTLGLLGLCPFVTRADQPPCLQYVVIDGTTSCLVWDVPDPAMTADRIARENRATIERNIAESRARASQPIRIVPQVSGEFVINPRPTRTIRTDCQTYSGGHTRCTSRLP